ncbi:hypothetical protein Pres01_41420 [Metapseudomonas resinovorans]|uniref:hypothetical protein n=1 Tax=Metapseudomonas resinovorans TaxID=53412 RepID=UPI00098665FB|nr:hypothetical protein [Pseudomonas resinovorans]GLZ88091.1 hypothetical protein Pres01_41420 [Pseudomonas resinovorans]
MQHAAAVANYLRPFIHDADAHYQWTFDEALATEIVGIEFDPTESWLEKTVRLKGFLGKQLMTTSDRNEHLRLAHYFISHWGGVRTNRKLDDLIDNTRRLASLGRAAFEDVPIEGVSSWSKYLTLLCDWAPIYDSRVAYSINAINFMAGQTQCFFAMPDGRSPRLSLIDLETLFVLSLAGDGLIADADLGHKHFASRTRGRYHTPARQTYGLYVRFLEEVAQQLNLAPGGSHTIEMLLFSLAPGKVLSDLIKRLSAQSPFGVSNWSIRG